MLLLILDGLPTPYAAARVVRRRTTFNKILSHTYSPRAKEKEYAIWQLKAQHNAAPVAGPIQLDFLFHMPIPARTSKKMKRQMLEGRVHHLSKPDTSNLIKFAEDCLKGIVFIDDAQVFAVSGKKIFSETPKTIIKVYFNEEEKS